MPLLNTGATLAPTAFRSMSARSLTVVGTPVHGTQEVITDGVNGLLAPDTSAEGLRTTLRRLLADADLPARLGQEARRHALVHYTLERVLERELDVYRQLGVLH